MIVRVYHYDHCGKSITSYCAGGKSLVCIGLWHLFMAILCCNCLFFFFVYFLSLAVVFVDLFLLRLIVMLASKLRKEKIKAYNEYTISSGQPDKQLSPLKEFKIFTHFN